MTTAVPAPMFDCIGGANVKNPQIARAQLGSCILAGIYVDGEYAWTTEQRGLFPQVNHVYISVIPGSPEALSAHVADAERFAYSAAQAAAWAHEKHDRGEWPTIYVSRSGIPGIRTATGSLILGRDYDIWCADWTGAAHEVIAPPPGMAALCAATQYAANVHGVWDRSARYDSRWPQS